MKLLNRIALPLLAASWAVAATAAGSDATDDSRSAPESQAAMKVFIDPATGEFRAPTTDEAKALELDSAKAVKPRRSDMPRTEAEAMKSEQTHADGSVSMLVPQDLMSDLVVEIDANGNTRMRHVGDTHGAHAHDATEARND